MNKIFSIVFLGLGASSLVLAQSVPEIDPGSASSALALLAGAILLVRRSCEPQT